MLAALRRYDVLGGPPDETAFERVATLAVRFFDILTAGVYFYFVDDEGRWVGAQVDHFDVNVKGVFLDMEHTVPRTKGNGRGSIIDMSSIAGLAGVAVMPATAAAEARSV